MDELPGNSNKAKEQTESPKPALNGKVNSETEEVAVKKVVVGTAIERKKPLGKRFSETFLGGQAKDAANYVMFEVLVPALRDTIVDMVSGGIERLVKGDSRRGVSRGGSGPSKTYINYNGISRPGYRPDPRGETRQLSRRAREEHDFTEVVFDIRSDADDVLERLFDRIQEFNEVTVADFKNLCGISPAYTDRKWGWTDIEKSRVVRVGHDQYIIEMPKTEHLPHR